MTTVAGYRSGDNCPRDGELNARVLLPICSRACRDASTCIATYGPAKVHGGAPSGCISYGGFTVKQLAALGQAGFRAGQSRL